MNKDIKFEDAMKRLEEIVEELETGNFDLDKSIEIFEEGIKLSKFLKKKLDEAEQKIEIIKNKKLDTDIENETKEDYTTEPFLLNNNQ